MKKISTEIAIKLALFIFTLSALMTIFLYQSFYQIISETNVTKNLTQIHAYASLFEDEMEHGSLAVDLVLRHVKDEYEVLALDSKSTFPKEIINDLQSEFVDHINGHELIKSVSFFFYPDDPIQSEIFSFDITQDGSLDPVEMSLDDAVLKASHNATWRELYESNSGGKWSDLYSDEKGVQLIGYSTFLKQDGQRICLIVTELEPGRALFDFESTDNASKGQFLMLSTDQIAYNHSGLTIDKATEILSFIPESIQSNQERIYQIDSEGKYIGLLTPINEKWWLLGLYTKVNLKDNVRNALFPWVWIVIGIVFFFLISMYFFVSSLIKPLKYLTDSVVAYDGLGMQFVIPKMIKRSRNEFSILANAIHGLIERIAQFGDKVDYQNQELIDEIEAKEQMIKDLSIASKIIDGAREGICVTDNDFKIKYVNDMFEQITGFKKLEVIGLDISVLDPKGNQISNSIYEELKMFSIWSGYIKQLKKDGTTYDQKLTLRTMTDAEGLVDNYIATFEELLDMSLMTVDHRLYDPLTGLVTKESLIKELESRMGKRDQKLALFLLGIDSFRAINQTMGHEVGDDILRRLTSRIINAVPASSSLVVRFGGDEFAILTDHYTDRHQLADLAENFLAITNEPFVINDDKIFITSSVGICIYPEDADTVDKLFKRVTSALHVAKESGRKTYKFFSKEELELVNKRIKLMSLMHEGWKNKEFYLVYQPKLDLQTEKVIGAEALMRWKSLALGEVSPVEFIPIAEELGLINQMGAWSINEATERIAQIQKLGISPFRLSVNMSYYQLLDEEILSIVKGAISSRRISPDSLELEITESILMTNLKRARNILSKLKAIGVMISVDDFGTGYSSLSYLKNLPIDVLKIDRSFIKDIPKDDGTIAKIIIQLAENLKMHVIAEGVETIEQIDFLKLNNCYEAQGYYYAKPLEFIDFIDYCTNQNKAI